MDPFLIVVVGALATLAAVLLRGVYREHKIRQADIDNALRLYRRDTAIDEARRAAKEEARRRDGREGATIVSLADYRERRRERNAAS